MNEPQEMRKSLQLEVEKQDKSTRSLGLMTLVSFLVTGAFVLLAFQNSMQQATLDAQTERTNDLIAQIRDLAEQNRDLNQRSVNYAYCNAAILARYTQNMIPIEIKDLDECTLTSFPETPAPQGVSEPAPVRPQLAVPGNRPSQGVTTPASPQPPRAAEPRPAPTPAAPAPSTPTPPPNADVGPSTLLPGVELNLPCVNLLGIKIAC